MKFVDNKYYLPNFIISSTYGITVHILVISSSYGGVFIKERKTYQVPTEEDQV